MIRLALRAVFWSALIYMAWNAMLGQALWMPAPLALILGSLVSVLQWRT